MPTVVTSGRAATASRPTGTGYQLNKDSALAQGLVCLQDDWTQRELVTGAVASLVGTKLQGQPWPIQGVTRGYGSTAGVGTTDKLLTTFGTTSSLRSYAIWVNALGTGGGALGRMWDAGTTDLFYWDSTVGATPGFEYQRGYSGGAYVQRITAPSTNTWHLFIITFNAAFDNGGGALGLATIYQDGVAQSPIATTNGSGTLSTSGTFTLGNRLVTDTRNWDGYIGPFMVWDRLLNASEAWALYDPRTRWDLYWQKSRRVYVFQPAAVGGYLLVKN